MTPAPIESRARTLSDASLPLAARVKAAEHAANPLLETARVLLQALADTPSKLEVSAVVERRRWLEQEARLFAKVSSELRLRPEHVRSASYCLCSALDEAALQTSWGKDGLGGLEWQANGLAATAGHDRQGGDRVFSLIEEAMRDPREHFELIEVFQNVLDLGFQGRYRFEAGGHGRLQGLRERVHEVVVTGGLCAGDISHHARQPRQPVDPWVRPKAVRRTRRRIVVGLAGALLLGAVGYAAVDRWADDHREQMALAKHDQLAQQLGARLRDELAAGNVVMEGDAAQKVLRLRLVGMFGPGEATAAPWAASVVAAAGRVIATSAADAHLDVVGYADGIPAKAKDQRSNQTLSEARAWQLAQILLAAGVPVQRLSVSGRGDAEPVGDNRTAQGRAQNRRVEIILRL